MELKFEIVDTDLTPYLGYLADTRYGFAVSLFGQYVFERSYLKTEYTYESALQAFKDKYAERLIEVFGERDSW